MQSFSTVYGTHCGAGYVAKVLGGSVGTVHGLIRSGRLHAWRTKGGHHQISLSCLQKYVGELGLATTAGDVMLLAAGDVATQTDTQLVIGLNALLKTTYVSMQNIGAIKATIATTADDGSAVDTVAELKIIAATQVLKDYANATNGSGISVTPTLAIYKDAGVKALKTLSETTASGDIDATGATSAATIFGSAWLIALNSALDYQVGDSTFSIAKLQAIADSYYRILSEADGVVNSTTNVDVYPGVADGAGSYAGTNDPSATDYTNIGVTVGNTKSIDLLNDYVGLSQKQP